MNRKECPVIQRRQPIFLRDEDGDPTYNPEYGDLRKCTCGHTYHSHFIAEIWAASCDWCSCDAFEEKKKK